MKAAQPRSRQRNWELWLPIQWRYPAPSGQLIELREQRRRQRYALRHPLAPTLRPHLAGQTDAFYTRKPH
jgi:hypothetical protein